MTSPAGFEAAGRIVALLEAHDVDVSSPTEVATADGTLRATFEVEASVDILDGEIGEFECPHDDCDRTFRTQRELRGHLGSSEHGLDVPDGEFWCGYCGYGPTSWRGVNAHHGSSDHDGDPIRLDEPPDEADLVAPEDVPDHKDPELLATLYDEHDGSYTAMCRAHDFDVGPGRVRHYLIEFGIHEPTPQGEAGDDGPVYRDPEWLEERYQAADGNISEMARQVQADGHDIPYRTLQKNLKRFDIHEPDDHGKQSASGDETGGDEGQELHRCPHCDYETESERGLKIHIGQKHSDEDEEAERGDSDVVDEEDGDDPAADRSDRGDDVDDQDEADDVKSTTQIAEPQLSSETTVADDRSFGDVAPPWLDEASFFQAVEMAADFEDLAETLGWDDYATLDELVQVSDAGEDLHGYEPGVAADG